LEKSENNKKNQVKFRLEKLCPEMPTQSRWGVMTSGKYKEHPSSLQEVKGRRAFIRKLKGRGNHQKSTLKSSTAASLRLALTKVIKRELGGGNGKNLRGEYTINSTYIGPPQVCTKRNKGQCAGGEKGEKKTSGGGLKSLRYKKAGGDFTCN